MPSATASLLTQPGAWSQLSTALALNTRCESASLHSRRSAVWHTPSRQSFHLSPEVTRVHRLLGRRVKRHQHRQRRLVRLSSASSLVNHLARLATVPHRPPPSRRGASSRAACRARRRGKASRATPSPRRSKGAPTRTIRLPCISAFFDLAVALAELARAALSARPAAVPSAPSPPCLHKSRSTCSQPLPVEQAAVPMEATAHQLSSLVRALAGWPGPRIERSEVARRKVRDALGAAHADQEACSHLAV